MKQDRFVTASEAETRERAKQWATTLAPGSTLLLSGDLGTGKTAFVRGVAAGLGIDPDEVTSPTFTLVHEYRSGRLPLVHVDLYRLAAVRLDEIGLDAELAENGVLAIEWAERLIDRLTDAVTIEILDTGQDARAITITYSDPPSPSS